MKIDIHNHAIPREALEILVSDPAFGASLDDGWLKLHDGFAFPLADSFLDPEPKLEELKANELDAAVLSVAPPTFFYDLPAELGARYAKAINEGFVRFSNYAPDLFRWFAHVPMQDVSLACDMLREAHSKGAIGVEIATLILGSRPDEPQFDRFWKTADELGMLVMLHPYYNPPFRGLEDWYLQNAAGNPQETMVAGERVICSGLLDRYTNLRVLLVHGGGNLPYQLGRLRHAIAVRPELVDVNPDPWSYCGRILFDSLTHDEQATAYLVQRVGQENVFVGTDLPFDMAPDKPITRLHTALGKTLAEQVQTLNPCAMFGFPSDRQD
ncbi:amidohydrolase family protein [Ruegeria sp. EL01]|jgi:aminocarboxymuconate-semialdehyde decarboxylase|uniref:amidohydrolase family protein n=1 Tax=Ruegeria sp. EL01 TaxID=2107578 RepID=UPI000EA81001|nr:amidohydrolase family protein [Ruegeria sp. EL01]